MLRLNPSLVGSQMSSDAMSEESLVREGAGYDKAFGSGVESKISHLRQGERCQPSPSTARMSVMLRRVRR